MPTSAPTSSPAADNVIVKAAIYPSIGVARIGNSPDQYFIGPEVTHPNPEPPGHYRDEHGRLKRQAARFRVYGLNAAGAIVRELTPDDQNVAVKWTVKVSNTKSAWYTFQLALDIPEATSAHPTTLRNPGVSDRSRLAITPSPQSVEGCCARARKFDDGSFMDKHVYLGEISTDQKGRLLFLGGRGVSASYDGSVAITFANNEGWHDDVCDGPVTAEVMLNGTALDVASAWVIVGPPNYAPQRKSVRTMWDLMRDVAIANKALTASVRPSFTDEILPIFERLNGLQWVNAGFYAGFGWKGSIDFGDPRFLARLADNRPIESHLRHSLALQFRDYSVDSWSSKPWPWIYGDAMNIPAAQSPRQNSVIGDTQRAMLKAWADGNFESDYDPNRSHPTSIDDCPVAEQGDLLTRAALEFCLADAFHPGCEMTWPVRHWSMYAAPFRFAHQAPDWVEPGMGAVITMDDLSVPNGPLGPQVAGGITRWMAVPWQCDTASCRSGYDKSYDPFVPTFWAARVPNHVLTKDDYAVVVDSSKPLDDRLAAFARRAFWYAQLNVKATYTVQINNMVKGFGQMGLVEVLPGPTDTNEFPRSIEVADRCDVIQDPKAVTSLAAPQTHIPAAEVNSLKDIAKVHRFADPRRIRNDP